jgi:hypothetical protein
MCLSFQTLARVALDVLKSQLNPSQGCPWKNKNRSVSAFAALREHRLQIGHDENATCCLLGLSDSPGGLAILQRP